jgi:hypothetical protein
MKKWLQKILGVDTLIAELKKEDNSIYLDPDSGLNDNYLFDFKQGWRNGGFTINGSIPSEGSIDVDSNTEKTIKVKVKPIDVLDELETMPTPFSLDLIDEKIEILKDKKELIRQVYTKRELTALIERLEYRKKYEEHREFFERFSNTTDEKIKALTTKHGLVMESADIFIPEFPDEAINIMKLYREEFAKFSDKQLVFYVIAEAEDFEKADDKRDPILLVQSPFGFYYQILGAWDKEMLILHEL